MRDGGSGSDHRALADGHAADDGGVGSPTPIKLFPDLQELSRVVHRRWIPIVGKADVRADEDPILDGHPGRDEGECFDLDPPPEHCSTLYLDKRRDPGLVADLASVQVHEVRVMDDDVRAELNVGGDH